MNIFFVIESLPRQSKIALAASILSSVRPTIKELGRAGGVSDKRVYDWALDRRPYPKTKKVFFSTKRHKETEMMP